MGLSGIGGLLGLGPWEELGLVKPTVEELGLEFRVWGFSRSYLNSQKAQPLLRDWYKKS